MNKVENTFLEYQSQKIDKSSYIESMYALHHSKLFEYANFIKYSNIKKIEIEDGHVVMTSRDKGIRISCTMGDHRIAPIETLNFQDYEKADSKMMDLLLSDGDSFFDIGANIGWYSINLASSRRNSKIYAFEPIPKTFSQLQINLGLNAMSNVQAFNFGFSNVEGNFDFYYYSEGSGNASSANVSEREDVEKVKCTVKTFDQFIKNSSVKVDFIKCDVEGAELLVFEGAKGTIFKDKPIIFSEILRKWSAKFGYDPNSIFKFFKDMGYRSFVVRDLSLVEFLSMDESTVDTNFFFLHPEKHKFLISRYELNQ